jgi:hypothetical protein
MKRDRVEDSRFFQEFEQILFIYGFQECNLNTNLNFLKLNEIDYLLFRTFKNNTADLIHAKFRRGQNPCAYEPDWEEVIKFSFEPISHEYILKETIERLKVNQ